MEVARDPARCSELADEFMHHYRGMLRLTEAEAATLRRAMTASTDAELEAARGLIRDKLNHEAGASIVFAGLGILQLILELANPPTGQTSVLDALQRGHSIADGSVGVMRAINNVGVIMTVERQAVRNVLQIADSFLEVAQKPLGVAGAIFSIYNGACEISAGWEAGEPVMVLVGGMEIAAGVAAAVGVLFTVPGAQPIAVALGLGAFLVREVQEAQREQIPACKTQLLGLVEKLETLQGEGRPLADTLDLREPLRTLKLAAESWDSWALVRQDFNPMVTESYREAARVRLRRAGFHSTVIDPMLRDMLYH